MSEPTAPSQYTVAAMATAPSSSSDSGPKWPMVLLFVIVIGVLGLIGYIIYTFMKFKKDTDAALKRERETALSNAKYIVDQANHINTVFNSNIAMAQNTADYARAGMSNWGGYFDQVIRFGGAGSGSNIGSGSSGSGSGSAGSGQLKLGQLANAAVADMSLIKHTSFVSGLTAKDLTSEKAAVFCGTGTGANARCIRFPNAQGDTYLTSLAPGKSVVVDAPAVFKQGLSFTSNVGMGAEEVSGQTALAFKSGDEPVNGTMVLSKDSFMAMAGNQMYMMGDGAHVFGALDQEGNGTGLVVSKDGVQMSGDVFFVAGEKPYAKIGFNAADKTIEVKPLTESGASAGAAGKVIVHGDVVLADDSVRYGTVGRDYDASGRPIGLKIAGVLNNRLVMDTDVYLPTGRTLYGASSNQLPAGFAYGGSGAAVVASPAVV